MPNPTTLNSANQLAELIHQHLQNCRASTSRPLIAIIGPTASGKTSLGIAIAQQFNGEIISADSRQIYRQMSIGTALPTPAEQSQAPHHLINFLNPDQPFTLADYQKLANQTIAEIHHRQKISILVGGTGLYISAITQNYQLPDSRPDPALRQHYENLATTQGPLAVHQILQTLDPHAAAAIHPNNLRYVIRALEISSQTNAPKIDQKAPPAYHTLFLRIDWPRAELYQRIETRIDQQITAGLITETAHLLQQYGRHLPALSSLGYQQIADHLEGKQPLAQAITIFKQNTRNYAKRQLTWFRKLKPLYSISGHQLAAILSNLKSPKNTKTSHPKPPPSHGGLYQSKITPT